MYVIDFKNLLYLCSEDTTEKPLRTKFLISSNQTTTMGILVNLLMHTDIVQTRNQEGYRLIQGSTRHTLVKKSIILVTLIFNYSKIKQIYSKHTWLLLIQSKWHFFILSQVKSSQACLPTRPLTHLPACHDMAYSGQIHMKFFIWIFWKSAGKFSFH